MERIAFVVDGMMAMESLFDSWEDWPRQNESYTKSYAGDGRGSVCPTRSKTSPLRCAVAAGVKERCVNGLDDVGLIPFPGYYISDGG